MIYVVIKSRKLTIGLLIILLPLIIYEAQTRNVSGFIFIVFAVPLMLNLSLCFFDRIKKIKRLNASNIGFLLFHASFLVIMIGGIVTYSTYTIGYIELAEGQGFVDSRENYTAWIQKFATREGTGIEISVKKILLEFWENGQIKEFKNEIVVKDGQNVTEMTLNVNRPVKYGDLLINMARYYGLAPLFTVRTPHGDSSGYVNIREKKKVNEFEIPLAGRKAVVSYRNLHDNEIILSIMGGEQNILKKRVKKGDVIELDSGRLELTDITIWNGLTVAKDSGRVITYTGFFMFLAGLALYFIKKFSVEGRNG